jgi:hypothetical protein
MTHDCMWNGTTTLFAALNVLAGTALVISQARSITLGEAQRGWLA